MKLYSIPREKLVIMSKCYFGVHEDRDSPWEVLVPRRSTDPSELKLYSNTCKCRGSSIPC